MTINANSLNIPLAGNSVQCVVTSPPYYGLRDYGTAQWEGGDPDCKHEVGIATRGGLSSFQAASKGSFGDEAIKSGGSCPHCGAIRVDHQIGLEQTPDEYIQNLVSVFREVKRVLKDDGVLWLNIGDSYASNGQVAQTDDKTQWKKGSLENGKRSRARGAGDGIKPKDLIGIPWMAAFALRNDGWYLRQDIIWHKPNPMPESVKDRCTKAHEYIFLLTKSAKYYYDYEAVLEPATGYDGRKDTMFKGSVKNYGGVMPDGKPQSFAQNGHERWQYKNLQPDGQQPNTMHLKRLEGEEYLSPVRNKRSVWTVSTKPYKGAHYATFPPALIEPCILAGSKPGDIVLDPFVGSGTTVMVSRQHNRQGIGIDLNLDYIKNQAMKRIETQPLLMAI